jgi:hypothetical protein
MVSAPAPPARVSLPPPPMRMFPFALPVMVSLPLPPVKLLMLVIRSVLVAPTTAEPLPSTSLVPAASTTVRLAMVAVVYSTVLLPPAPSTLSRARSLVRTNRSAPPPPVSTLEPAPSVMVSPPWLPMTFSMPLRVSFPVCALLDNPVVRLTMAAAVVAARL